MRCGEQRTKISVFKAGAAPPCAIPMGTARTQNSATELVEGNKNRQIESAIREGTITGFGPRRSTILPKSVRDKKSPIALNTKNKPMLPRFFSMAYRGRKDDTLLMPKNMNIFTAAGKNTAYSKLQNVFGKGFASGTATAGALVSPWAFATFLSFLS